MDDFIYLISHDVRASVRALIELPQWIEEDLKDEGILLEGSVATSIDMMNRHAGRLDRMLIDLLTYSRVGRMQETELVDIGEILESVLEDLEVPAGFSVTQDLRALHTMAGQRDIMTLLGALIQNAIKHHDRASGQVHVATDQDGAWLRLAVSDDGPGIQPEFNERIFEAMRTLRPRDEVEGSGMGLTIVRKIATIYGGAASVAHPLFGRGTSIRVTLPAPKTT
ncbi:MAG: ATP-binding protein [Pseudomonadota bacterium]